MHVSRLKLTNFRNFERAEFTFTERGAAVCGDNGRGKSNLLEAVSFLALAKSGSNAADRDVMRWSSDHFVIEALVEREDRSLSLRVAYDHRARKKKAFLQDDPLPRLSELVGVFNAVLFSPEDVDLVLRDPAERRRLLDILVAQSSVSYLSDLDQYRRALAQRNRLLKESGRRLLQSPDLLAPWDAQLGQLGGRIIASRLRALAQISGALVSFYDRVAATEEVLSHRYRSPAASEDPAEATDALRAAYLARRSDEVEAGYTLTGPHRDNLVFTLDGHAAHQFGSKGQMKSVLLAWKLAEAVFLERQTGRRPVLLMDDVFSELDPGRALSALDLLGEFGQVILTSARDPDLSLDERGYGVIRL